MEIIRFYKILNENYESFENLTFGPVLSLIYT